MLCENCWLAQIGEYVAPEAIFSEKYPYFSSYSDSWLKHAERYVDKVISSGIVSDESFVVEIASNDGYLLRNFVSRGIRCLGVEPTENTAKVAIEKGIPTDVRFFGTETARDIATKHGPADLIIGNNVLAHVPDIRDFLNGVVVLLRRGGTATFEFPHVLRLIESCQFDTIYHEHFSYLSLSSLQVACDLLGLQVYDVEELPTHGGSLRIYLQHRGVDRAISEAVHQLARTERDKGLTSPRFYEDFAARVFEVKRELLEFLFRARADGKVVVGYGAPGKGNTLLNFCAIRPDLLQFTVDRNPAKQGTYTPGTRIPILDPSAIFEVKPDYILLLPWNLSSEIADQLSKVRDWGGKFVVPIPELRIF
jgi:SAM-dependent methyltransferase